MAESVLMAIVSSPGITKEGLRFRFEFALQPICLDELVSSRYRLLKIWIRGIDFWIYGHIIMISIVNLLQVPRLNEMFRIFSWHCWRWPVALRLARRYFRTWNWRRRLLVRLAWSFVTETAFCNFAFSMSKSSKNVQQFYGLVMFRVFIKTPHLLHSSNGRFGRAICCHLWWFVLFAFPVNYFFYQFYHTLFSVSLISDTLFRI